MHYLRYFCLPFLLLLLLGCQAEGGDVEINFGGGDPVYGPQPDVGGDEDADTSRDDKEPEEQKRDLGKETARESEEDSGTGEAEEDSRETTEEMEPRPAPKEPKEKDELDRILDDILTPEDKQRPTQIPIRHCPEIDDLQGIQEEIRDVVCGFITWANVQYIHHSGLRHGPKGASRHNTGHALDFRINSYEGMRRRQKLGMWNVDVSLFIHYFMHQHSGLDLGLGIYCDSNNPFFHVDVREKDATWSRIGGKYLSFQHCLDWLHNELR